MIQFRNTNTRVLNQAQRDVFVMFAFPAVPFMCLRNNECVLLGAGQPV